MRRRPRLWIAAGMMDVGLRFAMQLLSTVVIARILAPEAFGTATMVLVTSGMLAVFVGMPFEESLSQRRIVRTAHFETALFVSLIAAAAVAAGALAFGPVLERAIGAEGFGRAFFFASLFLFAQGPAAIVRTVCRRRRNFVDLAACQAIATTLACAAAIGAALAGWGVNALVLQRLLPLVILPLLLMARFRIDGASVLLWPRWHAARFRELRRFTSLHVGDLALGTVTPAVLAFLVNGTLGTAALGQFNIALRIVDPLRNAILGIGHNIVFATLAPLASDGRALIVANARIVATLAVISVPLFVGLGVGAPVLLPLLVGPQWPDAVPLAQILCMATAVSLPFYFFFSGFSALGRPEFGLVASVAGLAAVTLGFVGAVAAGVETAAAIGFLAGEIASTVLALGYALRLAGSELLPDLSRIARVGLAAVAMAVALRWGILGDTVDASWVIVAQVLAAGVGVFAAALAIACPACLGELYRFASDRQ